MASSRLLIQGRPRSADIAITIIKVSDLSCMCTVGFLPVAYHGRLLPWRMSCNRANYCSLGTHVCHHHIYDIGGGSPRVSFNSIIAVVETLS